MKRNRRWIWLALPGLAGETRSAAAPVPTVDECLEANYVDRTGEAADRTLDWTYGFGGSPERCLKIRVGQRVRWVGNFADHPLDPNQGDLPNPIAARGDSEFVTFDRAGRSVFAAIFTSRCAARSRWSRPRWPCPGQPAGQPGCWRRCWGRWAC